MDYNGTWMCRPNQSRGNPEPFRHRGRGRGHGRGFGRGPHNQWGSPSMPSWKYRPSFPYNTHPRQQRPPRHANRYSKRNRAPLLPSPLPPKPPSPLPGTEEYTQRNIQHASDLIKRQLNIDSLNSDEPFDFETSTAEIAAEPSTSPKGDDNNGVTAQESAKPKSKPKPAKVIDVNEIHDQIIKHICNLSHDKKKKLVNEGSSAYDMAISQIQKQQRAELSRALRDMSNKSIGDNSDCEIINAIIPDIGIKLENLPREVIAKLSSTLNVDLEGGEFVPHSNVVTSENRNNLNLQDTESFFLQAEEFLNSSFQADLKQNIFNVGVEQRGDANDEAFDFAFFESKSQQEGSKEFSFDLDFNTSQSFLEANDTSSYPKLKVRTDLINQPFEAIDTTENADAAQPDFDPFASNDYNNFMNHIESSSIASRPQDISQHTDTSQEVFDSIILPMQQNELITANEQQGAQSFSHESSSKKETGHITKNIESKTNLLDKPVKESRGTEEINKTQLPEYNSKHTKNDRRKRSPSSRKDRKEEKRDDKSRHRGDVEEGEQRKERHESHKEKDKRNHSPSKHQDSTDRKDTHKSRKKDKHKNKSQRHCDEVYNSKSKHAEHCQPSANSSKDKNLEEEKESIGNKKQNTSSESEKLSKSFRIPKKGQKSLFKPKDSVVKHEKETDKKNQADAYKKNMDLIKQITSSGMKPVESAKHNKHKQETDVEITKSKENIVEFQPQEMECAMDKSEENLKVKEEENNQVQNSSELLDQQNTIISVEELSKKESVSAKIIETVTDKIKVQNDTTNDNSDLSNRDLSTNKASQKKKKSGKQKDQIKKSKLGDNVVCSTSGFEKTKVDDVLDICNSKESLKRDDSACLKENSEMDGSSYLKERLINDVEEPKQDNISNTSCLKESLSSEGVNALDMYLDKSKKDITDVSESSTNDSGKSKGSSNEISLNDLKEKEDSTLGDAESNIQKSDKDNTNEFQVDRLEESCVKKDDIKCDVQTTKVDYSLEMPCLQQEMSVDLQNIKLNDMLDVPTSEEGVSTDSEKKVLSDMLDTFYSKEDAKQGFDDILDCSKEEMSITTSLKDEIESNFEGTKMDEQQNITDNLQEGDLIDTSCLEEAIRNDLQESTMDDILNTPNLKILTEQKKTVGNMSEMLDTSSKEFTEIEQIGYVAAAPSLNEGSISSVTCVKDESELDDVLSASGSNESVNKNHKRPRLRRKHKSAESSQANVTLKELYISLPRISEKEISLCTKVEDSFSDIENIKLETEECKETISLQLLTETVTEVLEAKETKTIEDSASVSKDEIIEAKFLLEEKIEDVKDELIDISEYTITNVVEEKEQKPIKPQKKTVGRKSKHKKLKQTESECSNPSSKLILKISKNKLIGETFNDQTQPPDEESNKTEHCEGDAFQEIKMENTLNLDNTSENIVKLESTSDLGELHNDSRSLRSGRNRSGSTKSEDVPSTLTKKGIKRKRSEKSKAILMNEEIQNLSDSSASLSINSFDASCNQRTITTPNSYPESSDNSSTPVAIKKMWKSPGERKQLPEHLSMITANQLYHNINLSPVMSLTEEVNYNDQEEEHGVPSSNNLVKTKSKKGKKKIKAATESSKPKFNSIAVQTEAEQETAVISEVNKKHRRRNVLRQLRDIDQQIERLNKLRENLYGELYSESDEELPQDLGNLNENKAESSNKVNDEIPPEIDDMSENCNKTWSEEKDFKCEEIVDDLPPILTKFSSELEAIDIKSDLVNDDTVLTTKASGRKKFNKKASEIESIPSNNPPTTRMRTLSNKHESQESDLPSSDNEAKGKLRSKRKLTVEESAEASSDASCAEPPTIKNKRFKIKLPIRQKLKRKASISAMDESIDNVVKEFSQELRDMGFPDKQPASPVLVSKNLTVNLQRCDLDKMKQNFDSSSDVKVEEIDDIKTEPVLEDIAMDSDILLEPPPVESSEDFRSRVDVEFEGWTGSILVIKAVNRNVLAGNDKGNFYFFSLDSGNMEKCLVLGEKPLTSLYLHKSDTSNVAYVGSLDKSMYLVHCDTMEVEKAVNVDSPIQCIESLWGFIFLGSHDGNLIRFNIKKEKVEDTIAISTTNVLALRATQEGARRVLLVATRSAPVAVRDAMSGLLMRTMDGAMNPTVYNVLLHKSYVYCGTSQHDVLVYAFQNGSLVHTHEHSKSSGVVCMNIVKNLLFVACYNGNIYVYNTSTNEYVASFSGATGLFLSMDVTEDMIIVGTRQHQFKAWHYSDSIRNQLH